jgi:phosphoacetylglucosamine mutase
MKRISYGTSGFRMKGNQLPFVVHWLGMFLRHYLWVLNGWSVGVMITASHNPWEDNGVKIIWPDGEMLHVNEEKILEDFVN